MSNSLSPDHSYELATSPTHFVLAGINSFLLRPHSIAIIANVIYTIIFVVSECTYLKVEFDLALHINKLNGLNQRNIVRNGICMQKSIRNDVSHIKFEQIVQKLYTQDICGGHLGFSLFVHFLRIIYKVAHIGCAIEYIDILNHASDTKLQ